MEVFAGVHGASDRKRALDIITMMEVCGRHVWTVHMTNTKIFLRYKFLYRTRQFYNKKGKILYQIRQILILLRIYATMGDNGFTEDHILDTQVVDW